jgi:hypothetical protein
MNNFFEGLKTQISTICICADGFYFFASKLLTQILFKFLLAYMKTLTNSGDFTGSRIRIYSFGGTPIQPLKKPPANHLPVILKSNTENRFKNLRLTE